MNGKTLTFGVSGMLWNHSLVMYDRRIGQRLLTFRNQNGKLVDSETDSTWDPLIGRALAGPLAGKYLKALPAIVSYKHVWYQFHPDSESY